MSQNNKHRGLGKGLESLLSSTTTTAQKDAAMMTAKSDPHKLAMFSGKTVVSLNVLDIIPNPRQPRHTFKEESLQELANSIKEHGIAQPLLVRKKGDKYELVAGERRLRASKIAGLIRVPAVIRDMSDEESLEIAIIENIQREDLNALDEAESYLLLIKEFNLNQEEVAKKVGKARSSVANALRLNDLPKEIKDSLRLGEITAGHARAILAVANIMDQLRLWEKIKNENLNVRDSEKIASAQSERQKNRPAGVDNNKGMENNKPGSFVNIEQELSQKFSTKVELSGTEHKGVINIKYFSRDDLDRIYSMILKNEII